MNRKLSKAEAMWIRWVWPQGEKRYSTAALAERFGVCRRTILDIIRNRYYADMFVEEYPNVPDAFWRTDDPEQQLLLLQSTIDEEVFQ